MMSRRKFENKMSRAFREYLRLQSYKKFFTFSFKKKKYENVLEFFFLDFDILDIRYAII